MQPYNMRCNITDSPFVTKAHDSFSIPLKIIDSKIAANKAKF